MDALNLTKRDIVCLLAASALIPVACFMAGFLIAGKAAYAAAVPVPADTAAIVSREKSDKPLTLLAEMPANTAEPDTDVQLEVPESEAEAPARHTQYLVQAGLFSTAQNAERYVGTLARKGISARVIDAERSGARHYRVVIGTFPSRGQADTYLAGVERVHDIDLYVVRVQAPPAYLASL